MPLQNLYFLNMSLTPRFEQFSKKNAGLVNRYIPYCPIFASLSSLEVYRECLICKHLFSHQLDIDCKKLFAFHTLLSTLQKRLQNCRFDVHTLLSTFQNRLQFCRTLNPRLHFLTCSPSGMNSMVSSSLSVKSSLSVSSSRSLETLTSSL